MPGIIAIILFSGAAAIFAGCAAGACVSQSADGQAACAPEPEPSPGQGQRPRDADACVVCAEPLTGPVLVTMSMYGLSGYHVRCHAALLAALRQRRFNRTTASLN